MNILVVDDEPDIKPMFLRRFRKQIKSKKINFLFAFSGEEAIGILEKQKENLDCNIVLILSDINMPGMSGLELLKHVKMEYPEKQVIMISAYGDEKNIKDAMKNGADGFISKPIDFPNLLEKILDKKLKNE